MCVSLYRYSHAKGQVCILCVCVCVCACAFVHDHQRDSLKIFKLLLSFLGFLGHVYGCHPYSGVDGGSWLKEVVKEVPPELIGVRV